MVGRPDFIRVAKARIRTTPNAKIDPTAIDKPGTAINILMNGASAMAEECDTRSAGRQATLLNATARADDLDRLTFEETFGKLARKPAAPATFALNLSRPGNSGSAGGFIQPGTEIVAGGITFTVDAPGIIVPVGGATTKPIGFTATSSIAGSVSNLAPSAVQGFKNASILFDPTFTCASQSTDPSVGSSSGGADPELDADFRARRAQFDAGLDRNIDFLAAMAKQVPGVVFAVGIEDLDPAGLPTGTASLYIGDINGRANVGLLQRVRAAMRGFRMLGQRINLVGAVPSLQSITLHIAVSSTSDIAATQGAVRSAVLAYVNALNPGDSLLVSGIAAAMKSVAGVVFEGSAPTGVIAPATDIAPASSSTVFRTTSDLITYG